MQILGIMDNSQHVPGAVTAVVTTYEPDLQTLETQFGRLAGQIDALLVIDNGSANAAEVAQLVSQFSFAQFCGAGENWGLGWAHNEGLRRALAEGADAVLLLDQDSLPSETMVVALRQALLQQRAAVSTVIAVASEGCSTRDAIACCKQSLSVAADVNCTKNVLHKWVFDENWCSRLADEQVKSGCD